MKSKRETTRSIRNCLAFGISAWLHESVDAGVMPFLSKADSGAVMHPTKI
jgi:hypothetical protein